MNNQINNNKFSSELFITQLDKINSFKENGIYTEEEYANKKIKLIIDLINNGISEELDDFLSKILILKEKNILAIDEIKQIKNSLFNKDLKRKNILPEDKIGTIKPTDKKTTVSSNQNQSSFKNKNKTTMLLSIGGTVLILLILISIIINNESKDYEFLTKIERLPLSTQKQLNEITKDIGTKKNDITALGTIFMTDCSNDNIKDVCKEILEEYRSSEYTDIVLGFVDIKLSKEELRSPEDRKKYGHEKIVYIYPKENKFISSDLNITGP